MGILKGRRAVRCPAGVTDAHRAGDGGAVLRHLAQCGQTTLGLSNLKGMLRKNAQAGRIIAAVFQLGKKYVSTISFSYITNDSTHIIKPPYVGG